MEYGCVLWEKKEIPEAEFQRRLDTVQDAMKEKGVGSLVVTHEVARFPSSNGDVTYLTNVLAFGRGFVVIPKDRPPNFLCVSRGAQPMPNVEVQSWGIDIDQKTGTLANCIEYMKSEGLTKEPIGLVANEKRAYLAYEKFAESLPGTQVIFLPRLLSDIRMLKSAEEIRLIRAGRPVIESTYQEFKRNLKPGAKKTEVTALAQKKARLQEAEDVGVAVGWSDSKYKGLSLIPGSGRVQSHAIILLKLMVRYRRYWLQAARTLALTKPPKEAVSLYASATAALDAGSKRLKPGQRASSVAEAVQSALENQGCGDYARDDVFGHGIGIDLHEQPLISTSDKTTIADGMCIALTIELRGKSGAVIVGNTFEVSPRGGKSMCADPEKTIPIVAE